MIFSTFISFRQLCRLVMSKFTDMSLDSTIFSQQICTKITVIASLDTLRLNYYVLCMKNQTLICQC